MILVVSASTFTVHSTDTNVHLIKLFVFQIVDRPEGLVSLHPFRKHYGSYISCVYTFVSKYIGTAREQYYMLSTTNVV